MPVSGSFRKAIEWEDDVSCWLLGGRVAKVVEFDGLKGKVDLRKLRSGIRTRRIFPMTLHGAPICAGHELPARLRKAEGIFSLHALP